MINPQDFIIQNRANQDRDPTPSGSTPDPIWLHTRPHLAPLPETKCPDRHKIINGLEVLEEIVIREKPNPEKRRLFFACKGIPLTILSSIPNTYLKLYLALIRKMFLCGSPDDLYLSKSDIEQWRINKKTKSRGLAVLEEMRYISVTRTAGKKNLINLLKITESEKQ